MEHSLDGVLYGSEAMLTIRRNGVPWQHVRVDPRCLSVRISVNKPTEFAVEHLADGCNCGQLDACGSEQPRITYIPEVAAALKSPTLFGLPVRTDPGMVTDKIRLMSKAWFDRAAEEWARGHELGPIQFETERVESGWRVTATSEIRKRPS